MEELLEELRVLKKRVQDLENAKDPTHSQLKPHEGKESPTNTVDGHIQRQVVINPQRPPITEPVPMAATRVIMHQLVPLSETDGFGICTGGQVLSWIDICAGLTAKSLARGPCVTASVDAVHFLRPCRTGMVVMIAAMVNRTFASSMEVGVRVEAEDMRSGSRYHCCSAYLTFVSLDARKSKERLLPRVVASSSEHDQIYAAAQARRADRLAEREAVRADPARSEAAARCRLQPITHRDGCPTLPPAVRLQEGDTPRRLAPGVTVAYMTQSIMPHHANTLGITFGGQVMRWMEQCAYISASRLRGGQFLTAAVDSLAFARPTRVGHIMYLTAVVTAVFGSSLEVMISVFGEDPNEGEGEGCVFPCADAFATVVTVDETGSPLTLPVEVVPSTVEEQLRYEGAWKRRADRLKMRNDLSAHFATRPSLDGTPPSRTCSMDTTFGLPKLDLNGT